MDSPIHGPSIILDEATYTKLRARTKSRDVEHVVFAEEVWRTLVYGIAKGDQDDPIASQTAARDIKELKAKGALLGTSSSSGMG